MRKYQCYLQHFYKLYMVLIEHHKYFFDDKKNKKLKKKRKIKKEVKYRFMN
jgi:hypothetical protein